MYYTIRHNNSIVAKCDSTAIAAGIVHMYLQGNPNAEVKVINNVYKRVAFNNRRKFVGAGMIAERINESDNRFCEEHTAKYEARHNA